MQGKQMNNSLYIIKDDEYFSGSSDGKDERDIGLNLFTVNFLNELAVVQQEFYLDGHNPFDIESPWLSEPLRQKHFRNGTKQE